MSLRTTYQLPNSNIGNRGDLQPESKLERTYRRLLVAYGVVQITYWLVVGGFLMLLPWLRFWENNALLYLFPSLRPVVANPFLKGAILGLGLVNLLIGLHEILIFGRNQEHPFQR
jgi:hypothetical protein